MFPLTITRVAATHLVSAMKKAGVRYARFSVRGGGCNGLTYELTPISQPESGASLVNLNETYAVELCMKSEMFLFGTTIDWKEGMMGQRFTFTNPNAATSCGCGETFSPLDKTDD